MKLNLNIIGRRKTFYRLSAVLIILGLGLLFFRGLNLGIDFQSGTLIEMDLKAAFTTAEVREVVLPYFDKVQVRDVRDGGETTTMVQIRTTETDEAKITQTIAALTAKWPGAELESAARVDAAFSGELVRNAIIALILASIGMIIYITIRFEIKFAISAVLALLHDVFVVLVVFSLLRVEVNSEFVAAILAIVGYSINDTIVVFDRIRENLTKAKRHSDVEELVNRSINETLWRSLNTSITTLLAIGAVFVLGGVTLRPLAFALVVGILAGTYSSIFVASSLWVDWRDGHGSRATELKKA
ncbi:MAG: protein translocase subunit SecF [Thermaerobacter sp.]|nr:protein translocase subunit SecF [Thermaerobacter sp.]